MGNEITILKKVKNTRKSILELISTYLSFLTLVPRVNLLTLRQSRHKYLYLFKQFIPAMVMIAGFYFALGQASALFFPTTNPYSVNGPSATVAVSYCANPNQAGETWVYPCQAETMTQVSYFDIWEYGTNKTINISGTYHCMTGNEGFQLATGELYNNKDNYVGSWGSGNRNYSNNCSNGYTGQTANLSITPNSFDCHYTYGGTVNNDNKVCEVIVSVTAEQNSNNSTGGGSVGVTLSVSGSESPNISPAESLSGNSSPALNNPDELKGGGWASNASQFGALGTQDFTFKSTCQASGNYYVGWQAVAVDNPNYTGYQSGNPNSPNVSFKLIDKSTGKTILTYSNNQITTYSPTPANNISWDGNGPFTFNGITYPGVQSPPDNTNDSYFGWMRYPLNTVMVASFPVNPDNIYEWQWKNVGSNDLVYYSLPFSLNSVYKTLNCWNLSGQSKVSTTSLSNNSSTTQFNSQIGNSGPLTASFTWKVQGCYYTNNKTSYCGSSTSNPNWFKACGSGGQNSNGVDTNIGAHICNDQNTLPENSQYYLNNSENPYVCSAGTFSSPKYCPSYAGQNAMVNYNFPTGAQPGDGYCERIYYTNTIGPNSGSSTSAPVCVSYNGPGSLPLAAFNCQSATFKTASSYSVSFPNASETPSPSSVTEKGISYALYMTNSSTAGSSPPSTSLNSGQFIPGEPGDASDDVASAKAIYGSNETYSVYNNLAFNPHGSPKGFPPLSGSPVATGNDIALNHSVTYNLTTNQLLSGSITWYLVLFNHVGVESVPTDLGSFAAYNSNTLYIQSVYKAPSINCFTAQCQINIVPGALGGNNTEANVAFNYSVTVTNTGSKDQSDVLNSTWSGTSDNLIITPSYYTGSSPAESDVGQNIAPGLTSNPVTFTSTPGNDGNSHLISATVGYQNIPNLKDIASCNSPTNGGVNSQNYEPFTLVPTAVMCTVNCNAEDPTNINYSTYVISTNGATNINVPATTTSSVYFIPVGSTAPQYHIGPAYESNNFTNSSSPPPSGSPNYTINPGTWSPPQPYSAGDQYCSEVVINSYSQGYVDSSGSVLNGSNANLSSTSCFTVHNEPYLQAFGNDVIGDSAFVPPNISCQDTSSYGSGIYAYSNTSSSTTPQNSSGSYSQFATQALCAIEGMSSAGLLRSSSSNYLPTYLSFSNTNNINGNGTAGGDATNLGGYFGVPVSAPTQNYFRDELPNSQSLSGNSIPTTSGDYNASTTGGGSTSYVQLGNSGQGNGDVQYIYPGTKIAIFVKGNVYITNNIEYAGSNHGSAWSSNNPIIGSINSIPSFWLIVSGNIYIAPNVTQLDGVYIAQPSSNNVTGPTGIIDTCAQATGAYQVSQLYGDVAQVTGNSVVHNGCNRQLTINGAIMDQATIFDRSFSSLRYSNNNNTSINGNISHTYISENPYNPSSQTCGTAGQDINGAYSSNSTFKTCAAEVINFTPEVYLSQPALEPIIGKYDYITSLPPLL